MSKLFHKQNDDEQWLPVSDLMAGLMMVFLFIAIALMRNAYIERDKIKEVAVAYQENQVAIYNSLMEEFKDDLNKWDAEIDKDTLTFTFKSPDLLFPSGKTNITSKYKEVLNSFFPRYLDVLFKFKNSINEVRIEGHTSSVWFNSTLDEAYFNNMKLSQGRTREVLRYIYNLDSVLNQKEWIRQNIAAVGFSSSKAVIENGIEDYAKSRRVSFRVITNAETQIRKILDASE
jgi:outer membrane protein OmpA-like peptidoglycan-associated protein